MRHRAKRSYIPRFLVPGPRQRGMVVGAAFVILGAVAGVGLATQHTQQTSARSDTPYASGPAGATGGPTAPGSQGQEPTSALTGASPQFSGRPSETPSRSESRTPSPADPTTSAGLESEVPSPAGSTTRQAPAPPSQDPTSQQPSPSDTTPSDTTAPDTSASTRSANADAWTISVSSDEASSYECSLDGGAYQPCGTTVTYRDLDRGWHTFAARATDGAGNTDPSPAQLSTKITGPGSQKG